MSFNIVLRSGSANPDGGDDDDDEKNDNDVLLVDVAGGFGHDLAGFVQSQHGSRLQGRVILQDLPIVIDDPVTKALPPRIEKQSHDFFTPQPVKGAKCYFMHIILHDWPDEDCIKILSHLRDAMTPGYSQLLVNDAILPETNCPLM